MTPLGHVLVVCDGVGGHALGRHASQLAVHTIQARLDAAPPGASPGAALREAIAEAGRAVHALGGDLPATGRPGATCVALLVHSGGTEVAHVGDSRAYLVRGPSIWQLTRDHSVVNEMIDRGVLAPELAKGHPEANIITRALGMRSDTDVELKAQPVQHQAGDTFVLASDGLTDVVLAEEILAVVGTSRTLEAACDALVDLANQRGGPDNVTVVLARLRGERGREPTLQDAPAATVLPKAPPPAPTLIEPVVRAPQRTAPGHLPFFAPGGREDPTKAVQRTQRRSVILLLVGVAVVALVLGSILLWWLLGEPR